MKKNVNFEANMRKPKLQGRGLFLRHSTCAHQVLPSQESLFSPSLSLSALTKCVRLNLLLQPTERRASAALPSLSCLQIFAQLPPSLPPLSFSLCIDMIMAMPMRSAVRLGEAFSPRIFSSLETSISCSNLLNSYNIQLCYIFISSPNHGAREAPPLLCTT